MSNRSEKERAYRERTDQLRLGERRALAAGLSADELSKDLAHLQAKLATKKRTIRSSEQKIKDLEMGLRQVAEGDYPYEAGDAETWAREILNDHRAAHWNSAPSDAPPSVESDTLVPNSDD